MFRSGCHVTVKTDPVSLDERTFLDNGSVVGENVYQPTQLKKNNPTKTL